MKWLKYYREKTGLSMSKLSEMIGVQLNTIWRWESERASPSVDTAKVLANILGITESELLNGPSTDNWELKVLVNKKGVETVDMTTSKSSAVLNVSDEGLSSKLCMRFS